MAFYGFYFAHFEFKDPVPTNSTRFFQDFISSSARYCIFANTFQSSGGFSSGAAASAIMASAARRRASPPPSLQVIAARERRDQQYHLYPFLSFYLLLLRDARRWENLVVPAVIGGHNLPSPGWNRVNWTAKKLGVPVHVWCHPWHPRCRCPCYFDDSWVLPGSNRLCREKSSLQVHIFWESH